MKRLLRARASSAGLSLFAATLGVGACNCGTPSIQDNNLFSTTISTSGTGGSAGADATTGNQGSTSSGGAASSGAGAGGGAGTSGGPAMSSGAGASSGAGTSSAGTSSGAGASGGLPQDDLAAAQAFIEPLVLGLNIERGWAWSMPGANPTGSAEYWAYLKNTAGITHVRLFYPWRSSFAMGGGGPNNEPPDQASFGRILDAAGQAISAGLKVFLDCADVMGVEDLTGENGNAAESHMANCAAWTASRGFDPSMLAIGPVNEWAFGSDNTTFNDYRQHFHDVLRAQLPAYVLTTGPGWWKTRSWIYDPSKKFEPFSDLRVLYEWHSYDTFDAGGWAAEESKLAAWRAANGGRPTICGEVGPGYWEDQVNGIPMGQATWAWPALYQGMLPSIAAERPSLWAITNGSDYRLNKSDSDPHVMDGGNGSTNLLQSLLDNGAAMKAALGK